MKKNHCYLTALAAFAFFLSSCSTNLSNPYNKAHWANYYGKNLTTGNKFVDAGPNWTVEIDKKGSAIRKEYFYDTRQITSLTTYSNKALNKKEGVHITWTDNGVKTSEGDYVNDAREGKWSTYDRKSGKLTAESFYQNDNAQGTWVTYFEDGAKSYECPYVNNKKEGIATAYLNDGSVKLTEKWVDDKRIPEKVEEPAGGLNIEIAPSYPCDPKYAAMGDKCSERSMMQYISKNIRYPVMAREMGLQGRVIVQFVVNKEGNIENIEILRGISYAMQNEVIRVMKAMPQWTPGSQNGKPVKVLYTLPVGFKLE